MASLTSNLTLPAYFPVREVLRDVNGCPDFGIVHVGCDSCSVDTGRVHPHQARLGLMVTTMLGKSNKTLRFTLVDQKRQKDKHYLIKYN